MYESFFGLKKRPFAASPDADVLVESEAVADAVERLDLCIRQGRGIAVLTAAAGMGKTHLCHWLARRWGTEFRTALLPNGSFPTPRGLLQAILAELDQPYQRLGETELLLELTAVSRTARTRTAGVVLLLDEAHRYSERLLDEVRLIANLVEGGEPLVRIVLAGQLELEDKLASPALVGLNERVGELVTLPRLTALESRTYLEKRAVYAGMNLDELFEPDAIEVIIQACGGTPRCLNQLADHGLLLGYVAERRPVDDGLVREALDDLKRLPLQWNDPLPAATTEQRAAPLPSLPPLSGTTGQGFAEFGDNVIEIGGLSEVSSDVEIRQVPRQTTMTESANANAEPSGWTDEDSDESASAGSVTSCIRQDNAGPMRAVNKTIDVDERPAFETVKDSFARIDAAEARRRWFEDLDRAGMNTETPSGSLDRKAAPALSLEEPAPQRGSNPLATLDQMEPLIAEILGEGGSQSAGEEEQTAAAPFDGPAELDQFVADLEQAASAASGSQIPPETGHLGCVDRSSADSRRTSTLFSDLRRRHRELRDGRP